MNNNNDSSNATIPILSSFIIALQDSSHAEKQLAREKNVGLESNASLGDNSELASLGLEIIENYTKAYLRTHFPNLPEGESGVSAKLKMNIIVIIQVSLRSCIVLT